MWHIYHRSDLLSSKDFPLACKVFLVGLLMVAIASMVLWGFWRTVLVLGIVLMIGSLAAAVADDAG